MSGEEAARQGPCERRQARQDRFIGEAVKAVTPKPAIPE
jgi:hypothetical protein